MDSAAAALGAPVAELPVVGGALGALFPTESLKYFIVEYLPLLSVTVFPLLVVMLTVLGLCDARGDKSMKFGARTVLRSHLIAVRAERRMGIESRKSFIMRKAGFAYTKNAPKFMKPTASAMESGLAFSKVKAGKSADQTKAKNEEASIKMGAR